MHRPPATGAVAEVVVCVFWLSQHQHTTRRLGHALLYELCLALGANSCNAHNREKAPSTDIRAQKASLTTDKLSTNPVSYDVGVGRFSAAFQHLLSRTLS